jgi:hypothetical protein
MQHIIKKTAFAILFTTLLVNKAHSEFNFEGINVNPSLTYQFGKIDNKNSSGIGADLNFTALFNENIELGVGASYFESVLASGNNIPAQFNTSEIKKGLVPLYLVAKYNFNLADSQRLAIFFKLGEVEAEHEDLELIHNNITTPADSYKENFEIETSMFVGAGVEYSIVVYLA